MGNTELRAAYSPPITAHTSVRQLMKTYPLAKFVLERYGLAECGGPEGPDEAIGFFAEVHRVDTEALLRELNHLAKGKQGKSLPQSAQPKRQPMIFKPFLKASLLVAGTVGFGLGVSLLLALVLQVRLESLWLPLIQVHGHAQLIGWIGLFIMGVAYHVLPRMKHAPLRGERLAFTSLASLLVGLALRSAGQPLLPGVIGSSLVAVSSLLELLGGGIFLALILDVLRRGRRPHELFEVFILAGLLWLGLQALLHAGLVWEMLLSGRSFLLPDWNEALLHIQFYGFVTCFVFGVSLRTLPSFMLLASTRERWLWPAFALWNGGIILTVAGLTGLGSDLSLKPAIMLGTAAQAMACVLFVWALNILAKPRARVFVQSPARFFDAFIRSAYAWLLIAVGLALVQTLAPVPGLPNAARHAFAIGFVTMIIFGMAWRVVPVFTGNNPIVTKPIVAALVLTNGTALLRVAGELITPAISMVGNLLLGISGAIGLLALLIFGVSLWRLLDTQGKGGPQLIAPASIKPLTRRSQKMKITKDMTVAEALAAHPKALEVFLKHGFTPLQDPDLRAALAGTITIENATKLHPVDLDTLLRDLNAVDA